MRPQKPIILLPGVECSEPLIAWPLRNVTGFWAFFSLFEKWSRSRRGEKRGQPRIGGACRMVVGPPPARVSFDVT